MALMRIPTLTVKSMVKNVKAVAVHAALHVTFVRLVNVVRKSRSKLTIQTRKLNSLVSCHRSSQKQKLKRQLRQMHLLSKKHKQKSLGS